MLLSGLGKVAAVISCGMLLVTVMLTPSIQTFRQAEPFFADRKDKVFLMQEWNADAAEFSPDDSQAYIRQLYQHRQFIRQIEERMDGVLLKDVTKEAHRAHMVIWDAEYCNFRALPYLQSIIPEAAQADLDSFDCVLLLPQVFPATEQYRAKRFFTGIIRTYEHYRIPKERMQLIFYDPQMPVIALDATAENGYTFTHAAAICVVSESCQQRADVRKNSHDLLQFNTIYTLPDDDSLEMLSAGMPVSVTPVSIYEKFRADYAAKKTMLALSRYLVC